MFASAFALAPHRGTDSCAELILGRKLLRRGLTPLRWLRKKHLRFYLDCGVRIHQGWAQFVLESRRRKRRGNGWRRFRSRFWMDKRADDLMALLCDMAEHPDIEFRRIWQLPKPARDQAIKRAWIIEQILYRQSERDTFTLYHDLMRAPDIELYAALALIRLGQLNEDD